jgi:hypothetical protein
MMPMDEEIKPFDRMTPEEQEAFILAFEAVLAHDDGAAAKEHLAAGRAIYYREEDTPPGLVIREQPDGRREFVSFAGGHERTVANLDAA